jgi:hypothetical protein
MFVAGKKEEKERKRDWKEKEKERKRKEKERKESESDPAPSEGKTLGMVWQHQILWSQDTINLIMQTLPVYYALPLL